MAQLKVVVVLPTYNEAQNIEAVLGGVFALDVPGLEAVVVDDESPDGTGAIVERLAAREPRLHLLRRGPPAGRGLAGRDGFLFALQRGADFIVEMDADLSHQPRHIPRLLEAARRADVAIGSRLVEGGSDTDRPLWRRALTRCANLYARALLRLPVRDANSGFRCFSRRAMEAVRPSTLRSRGPSVLHEALERVARAGLSVVEVPIEFIDRRQGHSKLSLGRLAAGYLWILRLRLFS